MLPIFRNKAIAIAALAASAGAAVPAQAVYTVTLQQVGADVVATGSGTIDLTGLPLINNLTLAAAGITPAVGGIDTGPSVFTPISVYGGINGPTNFGMGGGTSADSGSGDLVGVAGFFHQLDVPRGYVSNSLLSDVALYNNQDAFSLGLPPVPGTFVWTWGMGSSHPDSFILDIDLPEPGTLTLLAIGLAGFGMLRTRRA